MILVFFLVFSMMSSMFEAEELKRFLVTLGGGVTGVLMSSNFLRPPNNQTTFSKTPNNQLSSFENKLDTKKMAWTMTNLKYQTPNNLA